MEYGLIGEHLPHSFSKEIHEQLADYTYALRELRPEELEPFLQKRDFRAINVTIPYKQDVIPALDEISDSAREIGAVNTIVNRGGRLCGYNTDCIGMEALIRRIGLPLAGRTVLVLGTGGTARTAQYVVQRLGAAEVQTVSRSGKGGSLTYEAAATDYAGAQVILNTTPAGMFPHPDAQAVDLTRFPALEGVMDVVYNHTAENDGSNFELTAPGYYHRHWNDGKYSDASACGNETASDLKQMQDYIVNSVKYWAKEYHIDGFRFDLMAIHDTETMNRVARELKEINPNIIIYGEGWTAGDSPLQPERRALKENVSKMEGIAVFSDDIRDAVKGHYSNEADPGFATGKPGNEETVKIGIVAATDHPQVDYSKGNNSKFPYAKSPEMIINYVSCHDDLCLTDKLHKSMPGATEQEMLDAAKLAQTIVFTSQGTPFMFAGEEVFRDKKGVHNSFESPDSINAIDWTNKTKYRDQFEYYKGLAALRKAHPAFRMTDAKEIARNLKFDKIDSKKQPNLISYSLLNNANGDEWKEIKVIFNGADHPQVVKLPKGKWQVVARDGKICLDNTLGTVTSPEVQVSPRSALIMHR